VLASYKERICIRNYNSAVFDLVAKTAAVAGTAIMGAPWMAASTPFAYIGGAATLASVACACFKWGFDTNDKVNVRDAQAMRAIVQVITPQKPKAAT
jgi:hypothetical protein